jgi:hypothetical protein
MFARGGGMSTLEQRNLICEPNRAGKWLRPAVVHALPWIEIAALVVLAGLLLWKGVLPGWRVLNTDFPNYYIVARLLREGYSLDRIYDWVWLQRIKDHWGLAQPLVGYAGLTPFSAIPIVPLSIFPALVAKRLWIICNLLLLGGSVELLTRVTLLGRRRVWLLVLLAVFPLRTCFLFGQMHLLVLFLLTLTYFFLCKEKQTACAAALALAGLLKVYPFAFALYFLWKKQWRMLFTLLSATLLFAAIGYVWMGREVIDTYILQILPRSIQGEVLDPYSAHAASAAALFHKLFIFEPILNPNPLLNSPALYAALYPLWQVAMLLPVLAVLNRQRDRLRAEPLEWAAYVFLLLVLSPVPSSYHFVAMTFSMVLLIDHLDVRKNYAIAALAVSLYLAISAVEFFPATVVAFSRLWCELLLWSVFLICLWRNRGGLRNDSWRAVSLYAFGVIVWTAGAFSYHRHFAHLKEDTARRIKVSVAAYLSTGVHRTFEGYLFTAMLRDRYRVVDQAGREVWRNHAGGAWRDELSAAAAPQAPLLLMEFADNTGSRVAILPSNASSTVPQHMPAWIADAESPAVSATGSSIAFIRETKGRGTLWLLRLGQPLGTLHAKPLQLVGPSYDVRNVAFAPSGLVLFAARVDRHVSIFSLFPGSDPRVFLSENDDVDSPAVSPDERFMAFTKLVENRWQLGYIDVATGHERMLTFGDCNAYSPEWAGPETIDYATDCGRGLGLTALASLSIERRPI